MVMLFIIVFLVLSNLFSNVVFNFGGVILIVFGMIINDDVDIRLILIIDSLSIFEGDVGGGVFMVFNVSVFGFGLFIDIMFDFISVDGMVMLVDNDYVVFVSGSIIILVGNLGIFFLMVCLVMDIKVEFDEMVYVILSNLFSNVCFSGDIVILIGIGIIVNDD